MFHLLGKKIIGLSVVVLLLGSLKSQVVGNLPNYDQNWLHFGISMGYSQSSYKIDRSLLLNVDDSILVVEPQKRPGFFLGIITNFAFGDNLDVRFVPSLLFANRSLHYRLVNDLEKVKDVESIFVDFPLLLKVKSKRMGNFRFYLFGGGKFALDMMSNSHAKDPGASNLILVQPDNWFVEYGLGTDHYFEYFKFSIEVKFSEGLNNVHQPNTDLRYSNVINGLFPKGFFVSFHFE